MAPNETVTPNIGKVEALILFEPALKIKDNAERLAL
jgi:hypothetical protein